MLVLFVHAFELLVSFLELCDLCGQPHIVILFVLHVPVVWVALHALPCKGSLQSAVLLILSAVSHVIGVLHTPMFLT